MSANDILAIITTKENQDKVSGGKPIFFTKDLEELEKVSSLIARLTLGMVHDLENGIKIIIRH